MIFSIDPSINSLGYAIFQEKEVLGTTTAKLVGFGTIHGQGGDIAPKILDIVTKLTLLKIAQGSTIVIEKPHFRGDVHGIASAAGGNLAKLLLLTGALILWGLLQGTVVLVEPYMWKGQLPKKITIKRMREKYGVICKNDDEYDAIGIGDWYIGKERNETV